MSFTNRNESHSDFWISHLVEIRRTCVNMWITRRQFCPPWTFLCQILLSPCLFPCSKRISFHFWDRSGPVETLPVHDRLSTMNDIQFNSELIWVKGPLVQWWVSSPRRQIGQRGETKSIDFQWCFVSLMSINSSSSERERERARNGRRRGKSVLCLQLNSLHSDHSSE